MHAVFNYAEAAFWWAFALVFVIRGFVKPSNPRRWQFILAAGYAGFGLSDWIEVGTGAWWRPWWLLALKAVCLLTILVMLRKLWPSLLASRKAKRGAEDPLDHD